MGLLRSLREMEERGLQIELWDTPPIKDEGRGGGEGQKAAGEQRGQQEDVLS